MGDVTALPADATPLCEGCRVHPAEVCVLAAGEEFEVCVECAADAVRHGRVRFAGEVTS